MVVANLPEDNPGLCGSDCVGIGRLSSGSQVWLGEGYIWRLIVFEDLKGEMVTIGIVSPASNLDEFFAQAKRDLDTVKWRSS